MTLEDDVLGTTEQTLNYVNTDTHKDWVKQFGRKH